MTRITSWSYRREKDADARVVKLNEQGFEATKSLFRGKWFVSIAWKQKNRKTVPVRRVAA